MRALEHFKDNLIVYIPFFLIYGIAGKLVHNDYLKLGIVFIGLTFLLALALTINDYLKKRNQRRLSANRWKFLSELSTNEQEAIKKQFEIGKIRGLWTIPELDEEIKNHFLNSSKVKIKVTRGFNIFVDDGKTTHRDIFYHCIHEFGKNQKRQIELLLHFPCLISDHTISRAKANRITPEKYIETLFEVIKSIKEVTKSSTNHNEITVKFYDDYEIKWRYYIFEERGSHKKTLFLNYYDDKKSGADSAMLKIEYGEGTLCHDFDKKFDEVFNNSNISKEIVSNLLNENDLLNSSICNHPECETKIKEIYSNVFGISTSSNSNNKTTKRK